jgi:hypothetical protein
MFCFEDDPFPIAHCRFDFDESVSNALYEKRYHSELALLLSKQAVNRPGFRGGRMGRFIPLGD